MFAMPRSRFQNSSGRWVFSSSFSAACRAALFISFTNRVEKRVTCACAKWKMKLPRSSTRSVARSKKIRRKSAARASRQQDGSHAQRPFVAATFAMTVDGKLTTKNRCTVDFTSRQDKLHLIRQRALGDAVL